jgi:hypothetical protein
MSNTNRITVTVAVDTDELRHWAEWHADRGHHGVAHVLFKAAKDGESLTEQAIREAKAGAVRSMAHLFRDMAPDAISRRQVIDLLDLRADSYDQHDTNTTEPRP